MSDNQTVSIIFSGDYHTYGDYDVFLKKNPDHNAFSDVDLKKEISNCDLSVFNLENPISDSADRCEKFGPYGVGSENSLSSVCSAGFNLATFATNHTYDAKDAGIKDTLQSCLNYGIDTVGAGLNIIDARKILYKDISGNRIATLNFSRKEFNVASKDYGGANPLDVINNSIDIKSAKKNSDFVFVVIHDGVELSHLPYPSLVKQARFYSDMGADAIIIHHSRYISGYEVYNRTPIFYGLGNLLHLSGDLEEDIGLLIKFNIDKNKKLTYDLLPIQLDKKKVQVTLSTGSDKRKILENIEYWSSIIKNDEKLESAWLDYVLTKKNLYLSILLYRSTLLFRIVEKLKLQYLLGKLLLFNKRKYLLIWNIFRCEVHNETVSTLLNEILNKSRK
jgi:poly-gamma-glutamate synthesis protein (capsule biosynthesis protein)